MISFNRFSVVAALLLSFSALNALSQVAVPGSYFSNYTYLLKIKNPDLNDFSYNSSIYYNLDTADWQLWPRFFYNQPVQDHIVFFDPLTKLSFNSGYPRSFNDGPVWEGKGLTLEATAGVQGSRGIFYFTLAPSVFYSQNLSFPLASIQPTFNPYNYQFATYGYIDWVQRYGDSGFVKFNPGQSEVRLIGTNKLTAGIGTQNISWGPSVFNPILMSKNAPGFLHADAGFYSPVELKFKNADLGKLDSRFYMGVMQRSAYHNSNSEHKYRYMTGFSATYQPPFVEGLKLGVHRVVYKSMEYFDYDDLVASVYRFGEGPDSLSNDFFDQMASGSIEYLLKKVDLRMYTEVAMNDFNGNMRDFLVDFGHSFAYTLGMQKNFRLPGEGELLFTYEHTNLSRSKGYVYRPVAPYYTHFYVKDGYTHGGQLQGAGIGPGSISDNLALDWYSPRGVVGVSIQRIAADVDFFLANYGFHVIPDIDFSNKRLQENEYSLGMNYARFTEHWMLGFDLTFSYRYNQYYIYRNDKVNLGGGFSLQYFLQNSKK